MRDATETATLPIGGTVQSLLLGSVVAISLTALAFPAAASGSADKRQEARAGTARAEPLRHVSYRPVAGHMASGVHHLTYFSKAAHPGGGSKLTKNGKGRLYAARYTYALQCVPFARAVSGIELKGNAVNWWEAAAGVYDRGNRPEPGSVLNFRANGGMRLGHVAVVRRIINDREIEVDHANWAWSGKSNISRGVAVIDVSERNDWTAVRVELGHSNAFGHTYSTYGFIYDRPDSGTTVANGGNGVHNAARVFHASEEVAEAPSRGADLIEDPPVHSLGRVAGHARGVRCVAGLGGRNP